MKMKYWYHYGISVAILLLIGVFCLVYKSNPKEKYFQANDQRFNYIGRFDFSDSIAPKCWASGATIQFSFKGSSCSVLLEDANYLGPHNYVEIIVDGKYTQRIKLKGKSNRVVVAKGLVKNNVHTVKICKGTEAKIGFLAFKGAYCDVLLASKKASKLIEFIGDSITCGTGSYLEESPCGSSDWYDQHSAYYSYGPSVCRKLQADWVLTSVSGYGLVRSCCGNTRTLLDVKDFTDLTFCSKKFKCKEEQLPDMECICLGQNDGLVPVEKLANAYIDLIQAEAKNKRTNNFLCIVSPMASDRLKQHLGAVMKEVSSFFSHQKKLNVAVFQFSKRYSSGCDTHPTKHEHQLMAQELFPVVKSMLMDRKSL